MFVIEFGPVGVFLATYYFSDFTTAALGLGIATLVTLVLSKVVNKRVPWFALFSGAITIVSSLITYIYSAPSVLIIKDTVYYCIFATILGVSLWHHHSVYKTFFGHIFAITETGWRTLEKRWFLFFLFAAASNEVVRVLLTVDEWIIYKQAILLIFLLFGLYQFKVSSKYRLAEADRLGLRRLGAK